MWVLAVVLLPVVFPDPYVLRVAAMTCIFAAFAASWDLLAGYAGQVNFGHALFFGAGAYSSALLIGYVEAITVFALPQGAFLKGAVALSIMVIVLLVRPEGLFGVAFEEER